jgi:hypothetical protein
MVAVTERERGVENRGVTPTWATEPPTWGEPTSRDLVRARLEEIERPKLFQFARPDGSRYEAPWQNKTSAQAWASVVGHRYLREVPTRTETAPAPRGTDDRGTEQPLSAPPLVQAPPPPPPPQPLPKRPEPVPSPTQPELRPVPKRRPAPLPPPKPEEYGIIEYLREDFIDTTMTESMPLISNWFDRVGKVLQTVPGLQGVGKAYEAIGEIADGLNLLYELIHELNQAEALEKGSKQVIKRTKPVKKVAEALLKKKYPTLPEPVRKKAAELLEKAFEKYVSDPAIERGVEEARELDENKDLQKSLWQELKNLLGTGTAVTPATAPAR